MDGRSLLTSVNRTRETSDDGDGDGDGNDNGDDNDNDDDDDDGKKMCSVLAIVFAGGIK